MPEEIVYGVCLPATGFSVLFVLLALLTVISVLVSGELTADSRRGFILRCSPCCRVCVLPPAAAEGGGGGRPRPRPRPGQRQGGAGLGHRHAAEDAQGVIPGDTDT